MTSPEEKAVNKIRRMSTNRNTYRHMDRIAVFKQILREYVRECFEQRLDRTYAKENVQHIVNYWRRKFANVHGIIYGTTRLLIPLQTRYINNLILRYSIHERNHTPRRLDLYNQRNQRILSSVIEDADTRRRENTPANDFYENTPDELRGEIESYLLY